MKKLIMTAAIVCAAAFTQAASVAWTNAGLANYKGDAYYMFVVGQKGVESISTVTSILDDGKDFSSYVFGGGTVNNSGAASQAVNSNSPTLGEGTYTAFMVLFDSSSAVAGVSKYAVLGDGLAGYTKTVGPSTASITFLGGNLGTAAGNANWKSFGSAGPAVPEPTSGLLLLLGMAGLALKRKVA